ncbi:MAG TPA: universal stress protein [Nitrospiraceae bacterium]|nr:universal stress protein [Nitrospiraceae bacterium]
MCFCEHKGGLMISKILVPTDGSTTARRAARYAVELAKETGATITLVSVIDPSFYAFQTIPDVVATPMRLREPIWDFLRQGAVANLDNAEKLCKKNGVRSKKVIRTGHPVEEIVKEAEKSRVDLIIIGSHGRSALKAAVIGSVAFGIIHKDTKVPVLVIRR